MGVVFYSVPALSEREVSPEGREKVLGEITIVREGQPEGNELAVRQEGKHEMPKEQFWLDQ